MRHWIVITTFVLLGIAFTVTIAWFIHSPDFEPVITSLALLTTITGLFIERWLAAREKRRELLNALMHELYMNKRVLEDSLFHPDTQPRTVANVYPRLYNATLETVIASGSFHQHHDRALFNLMHLWKQRVLEFNRRLDITELHTIVNPSADVIKAHRNGLTTGVVLKDTKKTFGDLSSHLLEHYPKESGVERNTVLFGDST